MTKKWKCDSIRPPVRWTKRAEEVSNPIATIIERSRRLARGGGPMIPKTTRMASNLDHHVLDAVASEDS
jgi:hypothetical protein